MNLSVTDSSIAGLKPPDVIHSITATPVNIPLVAPYRWSAGVYPGMSKTIVQVRTTNGILGIGEAPTWRAAAIIENGLKARLVGADPLDLADCERRCVPPVHLIRNEEDDSVVRAYAGIEMALWDIAGRTLGRSVASLLGGLVRREVEFSEYFAPRLAVDGQGGESTPVDIARYCGRMAEQYGSTCFEGKVGVFDLAVDVATAREVRNAIGDTATLRLDANKRWSLMDAREVLRRIEPFGVRSVEDPVRTAEEMARLRATTSVSFSSHEPDLRRAVRLGAPDAFVINLAALGGIRRTVEFVAACEQSDIGVWFFSPDAGVATAANLQVAAALGWIREPSQTLLRWHGDEVIAEGLIQPVRGRLDVPMGPGLGVTLDEAALRRCHERFVAEGPYEHFGDPSRPGRYSAWV